MRFLVMSGVVVAAFFVACGDKDTVRPDTGRTGTTVPVTNTMPPVTNRIPVKTNVRRPAPSKKGMVYIPGGWFRMSTGFENKGYRRVWVKAYYIDTTEVRNSDYARFIDAGGYSKKEYWSPAGWRWLQKSKVTAPRWWQEQRYNIGRSFPEHPVGGVSWYEADAYARWVGKRLPTEAEWERASRGDGKMFFPWGNDPVDYNGKVYANFSSHDDGYIYAAPVKSYPQGKSPFGCWNMVGNVWEWVQDWYVNSEDYKKLPEKNPVNNTPGGMKMLRGGSWYRSASFYIMYYRFKAEAGSRKYDDFGFRCALDVGR